VPNVGRRFRRFHELLAAAREILLAGRPLRGAKRTQVGALIDLALRFETWRTLCRDDGLTETEAVDLLAGLVGRL